jgi:flagellar hook protein FlgE
MFTRRWRMGILENVKNAVNLSQGRLTERTLPQDENMRNIDNEMSSVRKTKVYIRKSVGKKTEIKIDYANNLKDFFGREKY